MQQTTPSRSRRTSKRTIVATIAVYAVLMAILAVNSRYVYSDNGSALHPSATTQSSKTSAQGPEICDDGLDNDGNGLIDGADPACKNPMPTAESTIVPAPGGEDICSDGLDNDGDGKIDGADLGCACPDRTPATESPDRC